jgi:molybdopterin-guanine dinucleotide biosynthesis protein A
MDAAFHRSRLVGAILAGGSARRLGGVAKGLIEVGGERMIDRVARALREVTERIVVVSSNASASSWLAGADVISDEQPGSGPMGGIASALRATGGDVLAVAWDSGLVRSALFGPLLTAETGNDVVLWSLPSGIEPLIGLYRQSALPTIVAALARGEHRARDIVSLLRARTLTELPPGCSTESFFSVNTPEDLARAQLLAAGKRSPLAAH